MWPFKKKDPVPEATSSLLAVAARQSGFFAAHAVWCVAEGETLIPMLVHPSAQEKPAMTRLMADDSRVAVAEAKARLAQEAAEHGAVVLLYDTFVTLGTWRTDAILVEALVGSTQLVMAIPYRNAKSEQGFAVYKPKFIQCPEGEVQLIGQSFFDGVDSHEKGNAVWTKYIDQSR